MAKINAVITATHQKYFSIHDITKIACLTSIIIIFGITLQIRLSGKIIFQLADAVGFIFIITNPFYVGLTAFCIGLSMVDLLVGAAVYMPITLIITFLMALTIKSFQISHKSFMTYISFFLASCLIFIYVPYTWALNGQAAAMIELITDIFQSSFTLVISILLGLLIFRIHKNYDLISFPCLQKILIKQKLK